MTHAANLWDWGCRALGALIRHGRAAEAETSDLRIESVRYDALMTCATPSGNT